MVNSSILTTIELPCYSKLNHEFFPLNRLFGNGDPIIPSSYLWESSSLYVASSAHAPALPVNNFISPKSLSMSTTTNGISLVTSCQYIHSIVDIL